MGRFRAPSLRNIEKTAPYMHDGSLSTLEAVLDFYAAGGRNITSGPLAGDGRQNPNKSSLVAQINLTEQDKADLVAFLKTLTDEEFITSTKHADPFK
jgi:cytochrome c peroxidase